MTINIGDLISNPNYAPDTVIGMVTGRGSEVNSFTIKWWKIGDFTDGLGMHGSWDSDASAYAIKDWKKKLEDWKKELDAYEASW